MIETKLVGGELELFHDCQGNCRICFYDGGCKLQDKLNKDKEESNVKLEHY